MLEREREEEVVKETGRDERLERMERTSEDDNTLRLSYSRLRLSHSLPSPALDSFSLASNTAVPALPPPPPDALVTLTMREMDSRSESSARSHHSSTREFFITCSSGPIAAPTVFGAAPDREAKLQACMEELGRMDTEVGVEVGSSAAGQRGGTSASLRR